MITAVNHHGSANPAFCHGVALKKKCGADDLGNHRWFQMLSGVEGEFRCWFQELNSGVDRCCQNRCLLMMYSRTIWVLRDTKNSIFYTTQRVVFDFQRFYLMLLWHGKGQFCLEKVKISFFHAPFLFCARKSNWRDTTSTDSLSNDDVFLRRLDSTEVVLPQLVFVRGRDILIGRGALSLICVRKILPFSDPPSQT